MSLRRFGTGLALLVAGAFFPVGAQAAPVGGAPSTNIQIDPHAMVEKAQVFYWRNRRYCFYYDAWNGPGWYYCGYAWRRGYGWGGRSGWHGWRHYDRGPRRGRVDRPRRPGRDFDRPRRSDRATGRPSRPDRAGPRGGGRDRAAPRGGGRSVAPGGGGGRSAAPSGRGGGSFGGGGRGGSGGNPGGRGR